MMRKTMRVGEVRTSIKLESDFWSYLKEIADQRRIRLSALVNEVAQADPARTNLASTLRTYALNHARERSQVMARRLEELSLAGGSQDLVRLIEVCPLPGLLIDDERSIKMMNRAFTQWLNLDAKATQGQRLENILILRGQGMREMWSYLQDGRMARAAFNATYVSPGKVRTAQALAIAIGNAEASASGRRGYVILFETVASRA
jgi:predicted DNA-binding ribbon-helix-helix protein